MCYDIWSRVLQLSFYVFGEQRVEVVDLQKWGVDMKYFYKDTQVLEMEIRGNGVVVEGKFIQRQKRILCFQNFVV